MSGLWSLGRAVFMGTDGPDVIALRSFVWSHLVEFACRAFSEPLFLVSQDSGGAGH